MSALVEITVRSPLGAVTVTQQAGETWENSDQIAIDDLRTALTFAVKQVSGAYGLNLEVSCDE